MILIFDGLRVDAWEELVRPVLEEKYDVVDELKGSAILPSETHLSRKAISAGCLPSGFVSTSENALLENALKIHLGLTVKFKVEKQDENVECGISARYASDPIDVVIFNFTDKNLHNNSSDLAFIYEATVREILRQDVRSVLREMPADAAVFVLSDHGFTPVPTTPFMVPHVVTDSGDVNYRVGRLKTPLEGDDAKNGVCSRSATWASPTRFKAQRGRMDLQPCPVPRPGITLKRPQGPFSPDRYTHGGLSMAECFIPMIVLGPKIAFEPAFELVGIRFEGILTENQPIDILVQAKAKSPVLEDILFQLQVDAGQDESSPARKFSAAPNTSSRSGGRRRSTLRPPKSKGRQDREAGDGHRHLPLEEPDGEEHVHGRSRSCWIPPGFAALDSKLDSIMGMVPAGLR